MLKYTCGAIFPTPISCIVTNRYEYQPICRSRKEIRLLKLLPKDSKGKSRLIPACQIFHASLERKPKFVALSYVWGSTNDKRTIQVGNSQIQVTRNLYNAIMGLRKSKEDIIIWIDSLCINQSDKEEKSWQIAMMAQIYQDAYKVIAWLGLADDSSDSFIDYLNSIGSKAEVCCPEFAPKLCLEIWQELMFNPSVSVLNQPKDSTSTRRDMLIKDLPRDPFESLLHSISGWHDQDNLIPMEAMKSFFTRPWWGRIWVLQEVALPENVEFICGTKTVSRRRCSAFVNAFYALWRIVIAKNAIEPQSITPYHVHIIRSLMNRPRLMLDSWGIYRAGKAPLAALLRATCVGSVNLNHLGPHYLEATVPQDKIFALLSLAADREELEKLGLYPDCTKSDEDIYTTAMVALLQQGYIQLLSLCQTPKTLTLPSWVPDWSSFLTDPLQAENRGHVTPHPKFSASGAETQNPKVTIIKKDGTIEGMSLKGLIYDKIFQVGSFPGRVSAYEVPVHETLSWPIEWLVEILRLTYSDKRSYRHFSDRLRAVARSSTAGMGYDQNRELVRVGDDRYIGAIHLLEQGYEQIKDTHIRLEAQQFLCSKNTRRELKTRSSVGMRFGSEIIGKSLRRLPCITEKGHLVLSSERVKQGDIIALIKGSQVPFVLRHQGESQFQLISEAYVDEIMDGEAMTNSECEDIKLV